MARRKIVLFSPSLDAVSGVSTHARVLLSSELGRDYELLHFQVGSEGRRENSVQKLARLAFSPLSLGFLLVRTGAEAVHLNASLDPKAYWRDLAYSLVARLLGRRIVCQIHGGAMPQDFFHGNALLTWTLRHLLVSSDVVTVLSSAELAAYRSFDERIKVHLVPNAIDPAGLADRPRSYNEDQPLRLAYVGRLLRTKGLFELVEALTRLKRLGREFRVCIAGEGPDRRELVAVCETAGLQDRVRFLGNVFASEKFKLLLESDLFLLPSYMEGLPYSLLEAMAAGCVPITTPVAAIPDVVCDGEHGVFVPARDPGALAGAVAALDDDRERLMRIAKAARLRVLEHYTVARLASDFHRLYEGCLA